MPKTSKSIKKNAIDKNHQFKHYFFFMMKDKYYDAKKFKGLKN